MNCQEARQKIMESFAAGETVLSAELSAHTNSCVACREFCQKEEALFGSIDLELRAWTNSQVPPSLLAGLRTRLEQEASPRSSWNPGWRFALLAAASVLVVSFVLLRHHPSRRAGLENARVTPRETVAPARVAPPAESLEKSHASPSVHRQVVPVRREQVSVPGPEVLVLAEEREAFARFVATLPEHTEVAMALANPAPPQKDIPVEVTLLQIDELHLRPLALAEGE